jgi:hypothetical protein
MAATLMSMEFTMTSVIALAVWTLALPRKNMMMPAIAPVLAASSAKMMALLVFAWIARPYLKVIAFMATILRFAVGTTRTMPAAAAMAT